MTGIPNNEKSPNVVGYGKRYNREYNGVKLSIFQKIDKKMMIVINDEPLIRQFPSYKEALTYAKGYIDSISQCIKCRQL